MKEFETFFPIDTDEELGEAVHFCWEEMHERLEMTPPKVVPDARIVRKKTSLTRIIIPDYRDYQAGFREIKNGLYEGLFFPTANLILVRKEELTIPSAVIAEETGHAAHYSTIKDGPDSRKEVRAEHQMYDRAIVEAIGYFLSKLIFPRRRDGCNLGELLPKFQTTRDLERFVEDLTHKNPDYDFVHSQYSLGQRMYNCFIRGELKPNVIRRWMKMDSGKEGKARDFFFDLKYRILA